MKTILILMLVLLGSNSFASEEKRIRTAASALYLNFISPGNGIDYDTYNAAMSVLEEYTQQRGVKEFTKSYWGMEGEVSICIKFKGSSPFAKNIAYNFIKQIAPLVFADKENQGIQRTIVKLGTNCSEEQDATTQKIEAYLD